MNMQFCKVIGGIKSLELNKLSLNNQFGHDTSFRAEISVLCS